LSDTAGKFTRRDAAISKPRAGELIAKTAASVLYRPAFKVRSACCSGFSRRLPEGALLRQFIWWKQPPVQYRKRNRNAPGAGEPAN